MDWIFDNFQILALVGLALASWLKSRADAKAAEREAREARKELEEPEELPGPGEILREVIRRATQPEPPPLARTAPPPLGPAPPPALPPAEMELKRQRDLQERLRQIREAKAAASGGTTASRKRKAAKTLSSAPSGLRAALHERGQVRRAIVLREILGPPLGMR
jgi:hypothetical protein